MDVSFYIARRYLISKKSNNAINIISWISIIAIAVTTAALIIILSAMNGLVGVVANLYNAFEPDIRVTASSGKFFSAPDTMVSKIRDIPGVELVSLSLSDKVLLRHMDQQALVTVKGVDKYFSRITSIDSSVVEGSYELGTGTQAGIVVGRGVANQLQLSLNVLSDELSLFSPVRGKTGSLNPEDDLNQVYCKPVGIFSLNEELDSQFAFISLETARRLLDQPDKISALEIAVEEGKEDAAQEDLMTLLGPDFTVKNRYQLNDVLFKSLETEKLAAFIILAFILVIATFNIIGALTMLIIEKRKDIKTLYSLGAGTGMIRNIFMREGLLITGVGALGGLLIGLFVCWLQMEYHLVKFGSEFIVPYYPVELQLQDFVRIFILIMFIGFLAALYPVRVFTRADLLR